MFVKIKTSNFQKEIIDRDELFAIAFCPEINSYVLAVIVCWKAWYNRYYKITEEEYSLYSVNKEVFYKKFEKEISRKNPDCFSERYIASDALRDYDGLDGFQFLYPRPNNSNAFKGFLLVDNVLFARIVWEHEEIYVPPLRKNPQQDGTIIFPLREKCELVYKDKEPICFKLKEEYFPPNLINRKEFSD